MTLHYYLSNWQRAIEVRFRSTALRPTLPSPFISIVRSTCLSMALLPSNTEADLNSYDRENICVPEYFCTSKYRRYGDLFVWDTIARVCIFIYLFSWGEYECCLCLDAAEVNINNATELPRPPIFFRWIRLYITYVYILRYCTCTVAKINNIIHFL